MRTIKDVLNESYSGGELDKTVRLPERKKIQTAIYNKLEETKSTYGFFRDNSWEGVKKVREDVNTAIDELNAKLKDGSHYEISISPDNGGYNTSDDGMAKWKSYKIEVYKVRTNDDNPHPCMVGTLNCHAAGTVKDPFAVYDMSFCLFA